MLRDFFKQFLFKQKLLQNIGCTGIQYLAHGFKFCNARVACVIVAHTASPMAFHGYL